MRRARKDAGDSKRRVLRERYVALKRELLERAFQAFASRGRVRERRALDDFVGENSYWIHDYALYPRTQGSFRLSKLGGMARGPRTSRAERARIGAARPRAERPQILLLPVPRASAMENDSRLRARAWRLYRRRPRVFTRTRQRRGMGASGEFRSHAHYRHAARCIQRDRPALGTADAQLGGDARRRLRAVALAHASRARILRPGAYRSRGRALSHLFLRRR